MNFDDKSILELIEAKAQLEKVLANKQKGAVKEGLDKIKSIISEFNLSEEAVVSLFKKGSKSDKPRKQIAPATIKYKDDKGNTWTGRGVMPKWLREYEASGGSKDDLKVS